MYTALAHQPHFFLFMKGFKIQKGYSLKPSASQAKLDAKLKDAAKMYEKQFLREMVKAMRSTVKHSEMSKPGYAEKIYQNQLDNEYAENWGDTGGIGLSQLIYEQIKERHFNNKNIQKPSGPIPIDNNKFLKDNSDNKMIPVKKNSTDKDLTFIFDLNKLNTNKVTSPWDGVIKNIYDSNVGQVVEISHAKNLSSLISFNGKVDDGINTGDRLGHGQKIGETLGKSRNLYWKIFS